MHSGGCSPCRTRHAACALAVAGSRSRRYRSTLHFPCQPSAPPGPPRLVRLIGERVKRQKPRGETAGPAERPAVKHPVEILHVSSRNQLFHSIGIARMGTAAGGPCNGCCRGRAKGTIVCRSPRRAVCGSRLRRLPSGSRVQRRTMELASHRTPTGDPSASTGRSGVFLTETATVRSVPLSCTS